MGGDGSSKKLRKPYTITKSRDRWSEEEHERFLDGLLLFGREWKKIEDFVGTKTVIQIRSHAQKYFLKVQKNGLMAHVPPPRPKRNRAYHYTNNASEDDMVPFQAPVVCPSISSYLLPPTTSWDDRSVLINYSSFESMSPSDQHGVVTGAEGYSGSEGISGIYNQTCWAGSSNTSWPTCDVTKQGSQQAPYPVDPNFADIYNLIASVFEPEITFSLDFYLQKLKEMDPITAKTAMNLVKNLTANLSSPYFERLRGRLTTYDPNARAIGEVNVAAAANQIICLPSTCSNLFPSP